MHLVYRALEKEPVPALLPSALIPLSKRKKSLGSVPGLPASPPPPKDSLRSTPSHGSMNSLNSTGSLSPKHTLKSGQVKYTGSSYIMWKKCICFLNLFLFTSLSQPVDLHGYFFFIRNESFGLNAYMWYDLFQSGIYMCWCSIQNRQMNLSGHIHSSWGVLYWYFYLVWYSKLIKIGTSRSM